MLPSIDTKSKHYRRHTAFSTNSKNSANSLSHSRISHLKISTPISGSPPSSPHLTRAQELLNNYETKYKGCNTPDEMIKNTKSEYFEKRCFLSPSVERNIKNLNFQSQPNIGCIFNFNQIEPVTPQKTKKDIFKNSAYIERFYNSSDANLVQNKIYFPGD